MVNSPILDGEPFSVQKNRDIAAQFSRDGYVHIPGVLTPGEISALRDKTDEFLDDPDLQSQTTYNVDETQYIQMRNHKDTGRDLPFILRNTIELDQVFRDMLVREPIFSLAETIVGENSKFCGQNSIRNLPGIAIEEWHCDASDAYFPLPEEIKRHDRRVRMPVFWFTVQVALTDIERVEHGPTQYVPGSHYSGRNPNDQENPKFEGNGPVSVFCQAGDIYLQDPMTWHRGAPNTSDRTRYLFQSQYADHWAYTRFNLYNRVPVDEDALRASNDKLLNVLGRSRLIGKGPDTGYKSTRS